MPEDRAYIAGGHVYCRVEKRDMDVSECLGCWRLRELNKRPSPPFIVCELDGAPMSLMADAEYRAWWHTHHRPVR